MIKLKSIQSNVIEKRPEIWPQVRGLIVDYVRDSIWQPTWKSIGCCHETIKKNLWDIVSSKAIELRISSEK